MLKNYKPLLFTGYYKPAAGTIADNRLASRLTMRATGPTTRPAHPVAHFIQAHGDAAASGGGLLGRGDPTNPLVARQGRDIQPERAHRLVRLQGSAPISRQTMHRAAGQCRFSLFHTINILNVTQTPPCPAAPTVVIINS